MGNQESDVCRRECEENIKNRRSFQTIDIPNIQSNSKHSYQGQIKGSVCLDTIQEKVFITSGMSNENESGRFDCVDHVQVFNLKSKQWEKSGLIIPEKREGCATKILGENFFFCQGGSQYIRLGATSNFILKNDIMVYDFIKSSWSCYKMKEGTKISSTVGELLDLDGDGSELYFVVFGREVFWEEDPIGNSKYFINAFNVEKRRWEGVKKGNLFREEDYQICSKGCFIGNFFYIIVGKAHEGEGKVFSKNIRLVRIDIQNNEVDVVLDDIKNYIGYARMISFREKYIIFHKKKSSVRNGMNITRDEYDRIFEKNNNSSIIGFIDILNLETKKWLILKIKSNMKFPMLQNDPIITKDGLFCVVGGLLKKESNSDVEVVDLSKIIQHDLEEEDFEERCSFFRNLGNDYNIKYLNLKMINSEFGIPIFFLIL